MEYPESIQKLIKFFTHLPGVGPKTAERYVFYLLNQSGDELQKFAQTIAELKEKIIICKICNRVSETNPCSICSNTKRNPFKICVVSNTRELITIESTKIFDGHYHVTGGLIDTIKKIGPEDLNIKNLLIKIGQKKINEVILALNPTLEGETTALYISKLIKKNFKDVKITRLAKGLPTGADLEYADEITLANAIKYRNEI